MAAYLDIRSDLFKNSDLVNRITFAVVVSATSILNSPDTFPSSTADAAVIANRLKWASNVLLSPETYGSMLLMVVLAKNKDFTVAQILSASDSAIQSNVDSVLDSVTSVTVGTP